MQQASNTALATALKPGQKRAFVIRLMADWDMNGGYANVNVNRYNNINVNRQQINSSRWAANTAGGRPTAGGSGVRSRRACL